MIAADSLAWNLSNNGVTYMVTRKPKADPGGGDLAIATAWQQVVGDDIENSPLLRVFGDRFAYAVSDG